ncbi:MAG: DegT/DnrJ/EryC1/StrS family aminotransferase [Myxococcota bacterium]
MNVPFYRHAVSPDWASTVADVIATPFLTSGAVGRRVEATMAEFFGVPHVKLTNSWTNGCVATLLALDIGPGDEVIVPAMTFVACANVVTLVGATPVFADVDPNTLLVTPDSVAAAVTPATKAVMPVHLYGQVLDVRALRQRIGDLTIIEDAAHAFEATFDGDRPGTHGDCAIFSFYATKNVTCGEGGAVITRSADLAERIQQTVLHGMSAGAADRFKQGQYRHWDVARLGTKANLPDLLAALLEPQLPLVDAQRARRQAVHERYVAGLTGIDGVRWPTLHDAAVSAHHLFPIAVAPARRDDLLAHLGTHGVGATVNYNPVPLTTLYRERFGLTGADFPVATEWGHGTVSLPLYPDLPHDEQQYVIDSVRRFFDA